MPKVESIAGATAARIARDLFTNGQGERADRLVLTLDDGRTLGGWAEAAMRDRIEVLLNRPPREQG